MPRRIKIALDFGQPMILKEVMKREVCLDGVKAPVGSGAVVGNVVTLRLGAPGDPKVIGCISHRDCDGTPANPIVGARGIAALTFCDVPIDAKATRQTKAEPPPIA